MLLVSSQNSSTQSQVQQLPTEVAAIRFNSGQSVVPYFEGWIPKPDGSFDMVFGYFNRNFKEEFAIPAGTNNKVEPGPADAGQPTYFLARRQRYAFRVRVPKDFGKQEVVWTITANGRTEKGYGNLLPAQEITERVVMTNGNFDPGHDDPNKPPAITIAAVPAAAAGAPVTLTASVTDDGLPKPRVAAPQPAAPAAPAGPFGGQINSSSGGPRESAERQLASVSRAGQGDVLAYGDDSRVERPGGDHGPVRSPGHLHAGGDGDRPGSSLDEDGSHRDGDGGQAYRAALIAAAAPRLTKSE